MMTMTKKKENDDDDNTNDGDGDDYGGAQVAITSITMTRVAIRMHEATSH